MSVLTRRGVVAGLAALTLAGCSGVIPYSDRGPKNMLLKVTSAEQGFLTSRAVWLDVWSGPKGPDMEYIGTAPLTTEGNWIGLPLGQPLHLVLAFEESLRLSADGRTDSIEIPLDALRAGEARGITATFERNAFDYVMRRIR